MSEHDTTFHQTSMAYRISKNLTATGHTYGRNNQTTTFAMVQHTRHNKSPTYSDYLTSTHSITN